MSQNFSTTIATALVCLTAAGMLKASAAEELRAKAMQKNTVNQFQDNDNIVFIGDSHTCGGLYHTYLKLFYAVRYPQRNIRMRDCGIGGDTAAGALNRIEWDILSYKPNKAAIMLGGNDLGFRDYGADKNDAESFSKRQASVARGREDMEKLAERLLKEKVAVIFLTPPIFDQTAQLPAKNYLGFNDAVGALADYLRQLAGKYNSGYVDFYHILEEINARQQQKDPAYTITGPDRCHLGQPGHFVMAYAFLKSQNHSQYVAKMAIDAAKGTVSEEVNCKIAKLVASNSRITFNCLEAALPFPVPNNLKSALDLIPFQRELNNELLVITGLQPGQYKISIDNIDVGRYSNESLAQGINLADNPGTPQYMQASGVYKEIFKMRPMEASRRNYARIRHAYIKNSKVDFDNADDFRGEYQKNLDKMKGSERFQVYQDMLDSAMKYIGDRKKFDEEFAALHSSIYKNNQPAVRVYKIEKTNI